MTWQSDDKTDDNQGMLIIPHYDFEEVLDEFCSV